MPDERASTAVPQPSCVLVTGGAGFIGSHLCERLLQRGDTVVCFDSLDPYYDPAHKRRNLEALRRHGGFTFVEADVLDGERLAEVIAEHGVDRVAHLAARAGVRPSIATPQRYFGVNVNGTVNLLEAARRADVRGLVLASSSSVYGNGSRLPYHEADPVPHPISPYAASKRAMELAAYTYHHLYGLDIACLRLFTVYGPRQRPDMAIARFLERIRAGTPIELYGDGSTQRDYTFVGDIVDGFVAALDRIEGMGYEIINVGGGRPVTLRHLVESIERAVGSKAILRRLPDQPGDVEGTFADIERAGRLLGYRPSTPLEEGLRQHVAWIEEHQPVPLKPAAS